MKNDIVTPSILPGFLELLPKDQMLFNWMIDKIQQSYEKFGFIPLDTPIIEKSEVLLAKSGGETAKQVYRFTKGENDLCLRFDLTVPLARYVAQHQHEISFPFRRFQIGKVFRGEKPQRGRFREFYQCDVDIIGNEKLGILYDAEIVGVIYSTFAALGFNDFTIRINNRKILNGFFSSVNISDSTEVLRVIDKLEKIGLEGVKKELTMIKLNDEQVEKIVSFLNTLGNGEEIISSLKELEINNTLFNQGVTELEEVYNSISFFGVPSQNYNIDLTIARGLDYYTGTVYETTLNEDPDIGSICSGGRYDNLAENYTSKRLPGVGVSIGLSRLFYQLREKELLKYNISSTPTRLLIVPFPETVKYSLQIASQLREAGIATEVYLEEGKIGKKLGYADKLGIPYSLVIGSDEEKNGVFKVKNMKSGEVLEMDLSGIIEMLR